MKVIFFDIDGVLNCWDQTPRSTRVHVDQDKVDLLRSLLDDNTKLVLTSYHREFQDEDGWRVLTSNGYFNNSDFHPNYAIQNSIDIWLAHNHVDGYAIIDDVPIMSHRHNKHFIHINSTTGLKKADITEIQNVLKIS